MKAFRSMYEYYRSEHARLQVFADGIATIIHHESLDDKHKVDRIVSLMIAHYSRHPTIPDVRGPLTFRERMEMGEKLQIAQTFTSQAPHPAEDTSSRLSGSPPGRGAEQSEQAAPPDLPAAGRPQSLRSDDLGS